MKSAIQIQSSEGQHHPEVEIVELLFMIMIQQWPIHEVVLPPGRIGIWTFGFLRGGETRRTRRKTIAARMRINKKLNPHVTPGSPGIEPRLQWWQASRSPIFCSFCLTWIWSLKGFSVSLFVYGLIAVLWSCIQLALHVMWLIAKKWITASSS